MAIYANVDARDTQLFLWLRRYDDMCTMVKPYSIKGPTSNIFQKDAWILLHAEQEPHSLETLLTQGRLNYKGKGNNGQYCDERDVKR